ncbi:unnamed protein product [Meganyctiphanes norvegica]|uniref:Major facilitator superfamily (MFS) profile domain-containing protein n=1 Tax=Meganyctiphanes norvegica TaxID=48144 RepID=A0AAV2QSL9_MEGNR
MGVLNSPQKVIRAWINETVSSQYDIQMTANQEVTLWAITVSIFQVGSMIGALKGSAIVDWIGRRKAFLATHGFCLFSSIIFILCKYCNSIEMLILSRLCLGLSGGVGNTIVPLFLSEIAPSSLRGSFGVMHVVGFTFGLTISQITGMDVILGTSYFWPYLSAITIASSLFSMLLHPFLLESPVYLYFIVKDYNQGRNILSRINSDNNILEKEVQKLESEANCEDKSENNATVTLIDVLKSKDLRMPLFLVILLFFTHALSGINSVVPYGNLIFLSAGLSQTQSEIASICGTAISCFMCVVSVSLTLRYERRKLVLSSIIGCITCLAILITSLSLIGMHILTSYVAIAAFILFFVFFSYGLGALPFGITAELIPTQPRPAVMSLGITSANFCNFLAGLLHPLLQNAIGQFSLIVPMIFTLFAGIIFYKYLPETFKGK